MARGQAKFCFWANRVYFKKMTPSLSDLRRSGAVPNYFGLGFIQLKLDDARRIHFWTPDWPVIPGNDTEIHNHRYGFSSTILMGALDQVIYTVGKIHQDPIEGTMEMVEVSCQPGKADEPAFIGYVFPEARVVHRSKRGEGYAISPDEFHVATPVGNTINQVIRGPVVSEYARVIRPVGSVSTCPFSIEKSVDECWERIAEMLREK